jgi:hypothetical protein
LETDHLALSLSADGSQMAAVLTKTTTVNEQTGKPVPNPNHARLGQKSFFEFMEPHLMLDIALPTSPPAPADSLGNPYWCGKGLAQQFGRACGA